MDMDRCRSGTRTSSQSSGCAFGGSGELNFNQTHQDLPTTESMPIAWTDEKHSLYLESMEASFVNQLYSSMDLPDCQVQQKNSNPKLSDKVYCKTAPSGQFKVLRGGGCWKKIKFQRPELHVNIVTEPHSLLVNPWIQHFRSAGKTSSSQSQATNLSNRKTATCSKHSHLCRCYSCRVSIDSNKEMSDQNFVDEDVNNEKVIDTCSSKRTKMGASSNDQVVPHSKSPVIDTDK